MPGGNRNTSGSLNNVGSNGNWWSSTEDGTDAWNRNLNSSNSDVNRNSNDQDNGNSVRCLRDFKLKTKTTDSRWFLYIYETKFIGISKEQL